MLKVLSKIIIFSFIFISFQNLLSKDLKTKSSQIEIPETSVYNLKSKWLDQNKANFKLKELSGKNIVLTMIYTECKFSCPITLAFLQKIESKMDTSSLNKTMFILVSMDPENDKPDKLKLFLEKNKLNPNNWKLLTSKDENITELASTIGFKFKKISDKDYAHSNIITLFNSKGVVVTQLEGLNDENNEFLNKIINLPIVN